MYAFGVVAWEIATRKFPFKVVVVVVAVVTEAVEAGGQGNGHFVITDDSRCPRTCICVCVCVCCCRERIRIRLLGQWVRGKNLARRRGHF